MSSILTAPNPILRQVCKPVINLDKKVLNIIRDMQEALIAAKNPQGVGLAAPQIGILLRIFMIRPLPDRTITTFINPEIIKFSQALQSPEGKKGVYEGCLSLPRHYAPLTRAMSVTVKFQTLTTSPLTPLQNFGEGNKRGEVVEKTEVFSGFPAHIIQHELDHLNGILFIDRVLQQNSKLYKLEGKTWREISI